MTIPPGWGPLLLHTGRVTTNKEAIASNPRSGHCIQLTGVQAQTEALY